MFTVIEAQDRRVGRKIRVQTGSLICNTVIGLSEIQPTSLFCFSFSLGRNKSSFIAFIICSDSLICGTYLAVMPFWSMGLCTGGLQVTALLCQGMGRFGARCSDSVWVSCCRDSYVTVFKHDDKWEDAHWFVLIVFKDKLKLLFK